MTQSTCNGWTNHETWLIALWIENDATLYQQARSIAANRNDEDDDEGERLFHLAESLKTQIEESIPELEGAYADLLDCAIAQVNWLEIARNLADE